MPTFPSMVVVRVKSDHHKHEFACVALAEETLQEETAFFTIFNTQDKSSASRETDLNIIRPLLYQRFWFGFDLQHVVNTLQELYGSIGQTFPQAAGCFEGHRMFEEVFSQPCNSLYSAAEYLHLLPMNKRNLNARAECDITCEIVNQIALSWTTQPSQNVASPSEDQTSKNQEKMDTKTEPTSHGIVNSNIAVAENIEAPEQSFNSGHEEKEVYSHTDYNPAENAYGQDFNENTYNETYQQFTAENVAETTHAEDTHKRNDVKHSDKTAQDTHAVERESRAHASWKDLAKGKQTSVPSRPQLHVIPGVIQKKPSGQGRHKLFPPARDQQIIKQLVSNAIAGKRTIWISYEGGYRPLVPRGVTPTRWDDSGNNSFFGVPFHSKTGNETKFVLKQVKEVRERLWTRPEDANTNRGNSKNETKNERGDEKHTQRGSKHEEKNNEIDKSKTNGHNKPRPNKTRK